VIRAGFWLPIDAVPTFRALGLEAERGTALTRRRLGGSLLHAASNTDFYSTRLQQAGIVWADPILQRDPYRALAAIPPVSKRELRQAGSRVLAGGKVRPSWYSSTSSGSTGEPFRVYYDPRAWATLKYLVKLRARRVCGVRAGDRVAILDAAPVRRSSGLERGLPFRRISVLQPAAAVAAELIAFAPNVIYGLPSAMIETLGVLRGEGKRLRVRAVFTSGELLSQTTRALLAGGFQAPVRDVYGTSETKEIGWECSQGGMHLNSDVVHLEVLDDAGQSVPAGQEGNLVATSLVNRAMPLIRYVTGDRGALLPGTCACGRSTPLLGVVTGRSADVLVLRGGQRISPYALTCVIERIDGVLRYQVRQLDPASIRVRAILDGAADRDTVAAQVRSALRADVAPFLNAEVEFVDRLPTGPNAKFRVVEPQPLEAP
jgi:phenylacetate-CoA ligase